MDRIIIFIVLSVTLFGCSKELLEIQSSDNYIVTTFKSQNGFQYLTLNALETENDLYHPASFRINGIWLHHFQKNPYVLSVSEGKFNIKVSSVSKLPTFIEDLYISSGDSIVLDIKLEDDLSPLEDRQM